MDWDIRIFVEGLYSAEIDTIYNEDYFYFKNELSVGRVEVCLGGSYGHLCQDSFWNNQSASVVCKERGFSPYGEQRPHMQCLCKNILSKKTEI